jgi:hypothetical protein
MPEKLIILILLIGLNALYWMDYLKTFNNTSDDGAVGKALLGLLLLIPSGLILFNLDFLLR